MAERSEHEASRRGGLHAPAGESRPRKRDAPEDSCGAPRAPDTVEAAGWPAGRRDERARIFYAESSAARHSQRLLTRSCEASAQTRRLWAFALVLGLATWSCGSSAGEWTEDPENVERAWGIELPPDVVLEHSTYWRSPHFTCEEVYFFQFSPNQVVRQALIDANAWMPKDAASFDRTDTCREIPTWFPPKPQSVYDAWSRSDDSTNPAGWVFEDRETGTWFVYACQL